MSHIDSVSPAGPITLAPGEFVTIDVLVSGVPGDDEGVLKFTGSDGTVTTVEVTIDRNELEGILLGDPLPHQVLAEAVGVPGNLESIGAITGGWQFRFTAA